MLSFCCFLLIFIFLLPLIYFYQINNYLLVVIFKFLCSLSFVMCSFFGHKKSPYNQKYYRLFFPASILCMLGDISLVFSKTSYFLIGAVFFAIGHILFTLSFTTISPITTKDFIVFFIFYIPLLLFITFNSNFHFNNLLPVVLTYSFLITFMYAKAISFYKYKKENSICVYLTIMGSTMFIISDFLLLFVFFYKKSSVLLQFLNIILYYGGEGFLSLSLLFPFKRKIDELIKIKELS